MSQIVKELSFGVLSDAEFENSWCSCDFLEVSQEAKVSPSFLAWPLCPITMPFGHMGFRDGMLRERREHARGRNLPYCGRICGSPCESFGSIEEMWKKNSK